MEKIMKPCDLCDHSFQFGPQRYEGQYLNHYEMLLCEGCYKGNWDGFAPHYEEKIKAHLNSKGIPLPERNEKGWFPRDSR